VGRPTFELVALLEVELLDLHALEYLDVAWGIKWGRREEVGRNEEGSWRGSSGEALGQHMFLILTPPTLPHPIKTKHTCELLAVVQVQAGERHVLEHLDVAWGNGVGEEGRVRRNKEGSWKVFH